MAEHSEDRMDPAERCAHTLTRIHGHVPTRDQLRLRDDREEGDEE